jgi:hypothetical protein
VVDHARGVYLGGHLDGNVKGGGVGSSKGDGESIGLSG